MNAAIRKVYIPLNDTEITNLQQKAQDDEDTINDLLKQIDSQQEVQHELEEKLERRSETITITRACSRADEEQLVVALEAEKEEAPTTINVNGTPLQVSGEGITVNGKPLEGEEAAAKEGGEKEEAPQTVSINGTPFQVSGEGVTVNGKPLEGGEAETAGEAVPKAAEK